MSKPPWVSQTPVSIPNSRPVRLSLPRETTPPTGGEAGTLPPAPPLWVSKPPAADTGGTNPRWLTQARETTPWALRCRGGVQPPPAVASGETLSRPLLTAKLPRLADRGRRQTNPGPAITSPRGAKLLLPRPIQRRTHADRHARPTAADAICSSPVILYCPYHGGVGLEDENREE